MNYTIASYAFYIIVSIALTIWVARTLYLNGRVFLVDSFAGNEAFADSLNHLLVVGFYLVNIGYVALALRYGDRPMTPVDAVESVSTKIGTVLLVLGFMHFGNLVVLNRLRHRTASGANRHLKPAGNPFGT
jgi:hypothetical protein